MDNETLKWLAALGVLTVIGMIAFWEKWKLARLNGFDARLRDAVSTDQLKETVEALKSEISRSDKDLSAQLAEVRTSVSTDLAGVRISVEKQTRLMQETSNQHGQQVIDLYKQMLEMNKP